MKHIVIFGPPGSGKGTMTNLVIKNHEYMSLVAGDLLRAEKKSGSELGKTIASIIDKGSLVPDEMISDIIRKELHNLPQEIIYGEELGIMFDGYPRSVQQAIDLDTMIDIDIAIYLKCDEEILIKRLLERGKTSGREDDSNEGIIRDRMTNYWEVTDPVKAYYQSKGIYYEVDGDREIDTVYNNIEKFI